MTRFALSAVGRDRPGIVAGMTSALLTHGVNVEDSRMAVLGGQFTMMLVLAAGPEVQAAALRADLEAAASELGLAPPMLAELQSDSAAKPPAATHVVSVYGIDHPGIVHSVTSALAAAGASITDLRTQLAGSQDAPLYAMLIEVAGEPPGAEHLKALAASERIEISVRRLDPDVL